MARKEMKKRRQGNRGAVHKKASSSSSSSLTKIGSAKSPFSIQFKNGDLRRQADENWPKSISGDKLDRFLSAFARELTAEVGVREEVTNKEWMRRLKGLFCIGINQVTRALEGMHMQGRTVQLREAENPQNNEIEANHADSNRETDDAPRTKTLLQAVIVASDVHPRTLIGHLPTMASSRGVPLIMLSGGNGMGSLKLGKILNLRTAITIGLKTRDSPCFNVIKTFVEGAS